MTNIDMEEYEKRIATLKLISELYSGERSAEEFGWIDSDTVEKMLGINKG